MMGFSRRKLLCAATAVPLIPSRASAQTNSQSAVRHFARATPDGVFYDVLEPTSQPATATIVAVHGAGHTGLCYFATPDSRVGWAPYFAQHGYRVVVPDWPGTGRSGYVPYDKLNGEYVCERLGSLITSLGAPVVLMTHSMSGPYGWKLIEKHGKSITTLLAVAPGPPGNIQKPVQILSETPEKVEVQMATKISINLKEPVIGDDALIDKKLIGVNGTRFPREFRSAYAASLVPIPPRLIYERVNVGNNQLKVADYANFRDKRIAVVIGTDDPDHPVTMDKPIVDWLNQNGAKAEFIPLGERGIKGNGHMMMIETNNLEIADLLLNWLKA